ncbi:MAG: ECF transporter S component [Lachnospiraceae bacterium]|nr:ECF transporter S component [Lachnospiraceae bacterium]
MTAIYKLVITAVCTSLCIVLPIALHSIPNAGTLFSPMHIPVLLCGLVCGWQYGLICGISGPLLSSLITSMPAMAKLPFMMLELAVYGLIVAFVMQFLHTGRLLSDLYISLLTAMLSGRILAGIAQALFFAKEGYSFTLWASSYFFSCFPGILVQLILLPVLYLALERTGLIPVRYSSQFSKK